MSRAKAAAAVRIVISRQVQYVVVEVPARTWWAPGQWCGQGAFTSEGVLAEGAVCSPTQSEDEEALLPDGESLVADAVLDALLPDRPSTAAATQPKGLPQLPTSPPPVEAGALQAAMEPTDGGGKVNMRGKARNKKRKQKINFLITPIQLLRQTS